MQTLQKYTFIEVFLSKIKRKKENNAEREISPLFSIERYVNGQLSVEYHAKQEAVVINQLHISSGNNNNKKKSRRRRAFHLIACKGLAVLPSRCILELVQCQKHETKANRKQDKNIDSTTFKQSEALTLAESLSSATLFKRPCSCFTSCTTYLRSVSVYVSQWVNSHCNLTKCLYECIQVKIQNNTLQMIQ